uniref:Uncharacterized protein n=1 Tax=Arundo donax TaxID=35708 RepID=A0A0A9EJ38_ARUDO
MLPTNILKSNHMRMRLAWPGYK